MKEPRTKGAEPEQQDHSANYLFLIIGTPSAAFPIAASAMFESHGLPVPLVRIGTGVAGLILQTIPFMLLGAMMSAAVSTFVSAGFPSRHMPKSLAGGRAIAIPRSSHKPGGAAQPHGLNAAKKTITISDDEFGSWFEQIDHNPQQYVGYHVQVTGFVSKSRTFGTNEFEAPLQFMSCCILDMTPFGFMAISGKADALHNHDWVTIDAVIAQGTYGSTGHERQGLVLQVQSVAKTQTAPTVYFYWQ